MENVEDQIMDIVTWYNQLPSDYMDLNQLMYSRTQLATYQVFFAIETANARRDWKTKKSKYEIVKNQKRIQYEAKFGVMNKADYSARANSESELSNFTNAENDFYAKEYILFAVKEILSDMNQRIAHLREEERQSRYFGE